MKIYLINPGKETLPNSQQSAQLEKHGEVITILHTGKLADLTQLKEDQDQKIIGVDPDSFSWDLDVEALDNISNVLAICTSSTSFDWLKPAELKKRGIVACNVPGFSSDSVAEYAIAMAIEVSRRLPIFIKKGWDVDWDHRPQPMLLKGKKLAVIGLGRIGTRVAEIAKGIGMEVIYWSRNKRDDRFTYVELDELFSSCDVLIPTIVENEETKKLITKDRLDMLQKSTTMVGINRLRQLWDESYVMDKVTKGELGGYAFEGEGNNPGGEQNGNIWSLPAMAWYTKDSLENLMRIWVENLVAAAKGEYQNVV